ncbi:hypothetical protein BC829DRAFT_109593 [Chytridium lagenaria]|nr:hypothetical protein BC829DRAFT_109593 [Chytridium lagenaria]
MVHLNQRLKEEASESLRIKDEQLKKLTTMMINESKGKLQNPEARVDSAIATSPDRGFQFDQTSPTRNSFDVNADMIDMLRQVREERDDIKHQNVRLSQERNEITLVNEKLAAELSQISNYSSSIVGEYGKRLKELTGHLEHVLEESRNLREKVYYLEKDSQECKESLNGAHTKICDLHSENKALYDKCTSYENVLQSCLEELQAFMKKYDKDGEPLAFDQMHSHLIYLITTHTEQHDLLQEQYAKCNEFEDRLSKTMALHSDSVKRMEDLQEKYSALQILYDRHIIEISELERKIVSSSSLRVEEKDEDPTTKSQISKIAKMVNNLQAENHSLIKRLKNSDELTKVFEESIDALNQQLANLHKRSLENDKERDTLKQQLETVQITKQKGVGEIKFMLNTMWQATFVELVLGVIDLNSRMKHVVHAIRVNKFDHKRHKEWNPFIVINNANPYETFLAVASTDRMNLCKGFVNDMATYLDEILLSCGEREKYSTDMKRQCDIFKASFEDHANFANEVREIFEEKNANVADILYCVISSFEGLRRSLTQAQIECSASLKEKTNASEEDSMPFGAQLMEDTLKVDTDIHRLFHFILEEREKQIISYEQDLSRLKSDFTNLTYI